MKRYLAEVLTGDGCQRLLLCYSETLREAIAYFKETLPERYTLVSVEHDIGGLSFGENSGTLNYRKETKGWF